MNTNIWGYMYSYMHPSGQERLAVHTFGVSKTKSKNRLKSFNHGQMPDRKIEPLSIYSVNLVVNGIASAGEQQTQPERAPLSDKFLQPNDYYLLHRFIETTEDDEGYDITKAEIKRLADLGVVQSHGFGKYSVTMFGYWVHERYWEQNPSLPLKTNSDRNAEAAIKQGGQHD